MDEQNNYQDNTANAVYQIPPMNEGSNQPSGMQITSLVLGIISILFGCCGSWIAVVLGVIGLILAIVGNKNGKNGVGTAGFVCSIVGISLAVIMIVISMTVLLPFLKEMLIKLGMDEEALREIGYTEEMLKQLGF